MTATAPLSPFAIGAPACVDAGLSVLAIEPGTKRPGSYINGAWFPAAGWPLFAGRPADAPMRARWASWPAAGIGAVMGSRVDDEHILACLDLDELDPLILAELMAASPDSPMCKVGAKGETRFYRAPTGTVTARYNLHEDKRCFELLAAGAQTVLPPTIHPDTGLPYFWTAGPVDVATLPVFGPDDLAALEEIWLAHGGSREPQRATAPVAAGGGYASLGGDVTTHRALNNAAMANPDSWVPHLGIANLRWKAKGWAGTAHWRPSGAGNPVERRKLNLSIISTGIRDFGDMSAGGDHRSYTPLDLVCAASGATLDQAFAFLQEKLGVVDDDATGLREHGAVAHQLAILEDGTRYDTMTGEVPAPASRPAPSSSLLWDDREANATGRLSWLIKGLFPSRGVSLLWGTTGAGKSFVALELAATVITGQAFFGHRSKAPGGVLFALGEGAGSMPDRLNALRLGRFAGLAPDDPVNVGVKLDLDRLPIAMTNAADLSSPLHWLAFANQVRRAASEMEVIHGRRLRLVVVDTVVASFGFAEDPDAASVTKAMKAMDALAQELGLLVVAVHHAGKSKEAGEHGSYAWRGSAETSMQVDAERCEATGAVTKRRLLLKKSRHGSNEGWNTTFKLQSVPLGIDDDGDAIESAFVLPFEAGMGGANDNVAGVPAAANRFLDALAAVLLLDGREITRNGAGADDTPLLGANLRHVQADYVANAGGNIESAGRAFRRAKEGALTGNLIETLWCDGTEYAIRLPIN